jgi:hypothetical protein
MGDGGGSGVEMDVVGLQNWLSGILGSGLIGHLHFGLPIHFIPILQIKN